MKPINKKEQTPLIVHKAIEPYLAKRDNLFVRVDSEDDFVRFKGSSPNSVFFFDIKTFRISSQRKNQLNISYRPFSSQSSESKTVWIDCSNIKKHFDNWYNLISEYNSTKTAFDDPIINGFKEDYYSYFEIIDDEKDKPLDTSSIIPIYDHFEGIRLRLAEYKGFNNSQEIEDIQNDIENLKSSLTNSGRSEITSKICVIWAKLTKQGALYYKEFVEVSRKFIMKEGAKRIFNLAKKGIEYINGFDNLIN